MLITSSVDFLAEATRSESPLFSLEDMEEIIGGVETTVTLCAQGCTEEDKILSDAGMNDVHGPHGAARVVEDPFWLLLM